MINLTSQYPNQVFLAPAQIQITAQVNNATATNIPYPASLKTISRAASAKTAPNGSGAAMFQWDGMINSSAIYAFQTTLDAQRMVQEVAASKGHEYYIEISPIPATSYSILTWTSNL